MTIFFHKSTVCNLYAGLKLKTTKYSYNSIFYRRFVSRCPQDPGKTHTKHKALWTWRLVSMRGQGNKDYYTTSLFLFQNIILLFFPGRVNGIPGKLGLNVITGLTGNRLCKRWEFNALTFQWSQTAHAQPFPFLTTLFILFCSLLFLPFSKHCMTRTTPGAPLNEDLCEWESRKYFDKVWGKNSRMSL